MILVCLSLYRTRTNNNHPFLGVVLYHAILDDSSHPFLDVVIYHPDLDDPVIHFWMW